MSNHRTHPRLRIACGVALLTLTLPMQAQDAATPATTGAATPTEAAPERDPVALAALDKMGQALRSLPAFSLTSDTSLEIVLGDGQKIELDGTLSYKVLKPDKLYVEVKSDRKLRQLYFDGKELTIYSPRLKYYAHAKTKAKTLGELAANAAEKYDIEFPLSDLFYWGTERASPEDIKSALYVGAGMMDAERVDHYAFREEGADWQVWISQETSLPKKLVITSLDDPSLPEYTARLHWDTKTPIAASTFSFSPPADAREIEVLPADVASVDTAQEK